MDIVVRRQSEQLNRRHFSESMEDDDDTDKPNNKKFREIYDYRRWEWGNLRVILSISNHFDIECQLIYKSKFISLCMCMYVCVCAFIYCTFADGMWKLGPRNILSNVRATIAAQLFIGVFCDAHHSWYGSYNCFSCNTGRFNILRIIRVFFLSFVSFCFFLSKKKNTFLSIETLNWSQKKSCIFLLTNWQFISLHRNQRQLVRKCIVIWRV